MKCQHLSDCISMECGKVGSYMKCMNNGCACTLPKYTRNIITLETQMLLVCAVILIILLLVHMQPKDYPKFSDLAAEDSFIESLKFVGQKKGYVFKRDIRGIGYYKDHEKIKKHCP